MQSAQDTTRALVRDQTLTLRSRLFRHTVIVGAGTARYSLMAFCPRSLTVHVGQSVTYRMTGINEIHTVTFGPEPYVDAIEARLFPPPPPPMIIDPVGALPSQPPNTSAVLTTGLHGKGFLNSGILTDPGTRGAHTFALRFIRPGT